MVRRPASPAGAAPSRPFASSPMLVFYEVTQACDLICQHCRACAQSQRSANELNDAESRMLIDQLAEFPDRPMLVLTGGDPLKRPGIFSLVEHARHRGLEVSITPSATPLVTREALARLRDAGISRVAVSLDGVDATTHDSFRGVSGSYRRTMEILTDAQSLGMSTQVNTTLTLRNFHQLESTAQLLEGLGIVMWSVFFLIPVGRASDQGRLSAEQCEEAFARLWQISAQHSFAVKTTEAPHYRRFSRDQQNAERRAGVGRGERRPGSTSKMPFLAEAPLAPVPGEGRMATDRKMPTPGKSRSGVPPYRSMGVNDGNGIMFISHAGLIHPSGFLPMVCGIFPHNHVVEVYQKSPLFRSLREPDRLEGKCGICNFRKLCGGSRARAMATTGNPFAEEPDCVYEPIPAS